MNPIGQTESGACLAHPAELTSYQNGVDSSSMGSAAVQSVFDGFPAELEVSESDLSWRERAACLIEDAKELDGLVPQSALPDVLGISRQRVHQLIQSGQFELRRIFDVPFITGRSIDAWEKDEDKAKGGWRARRGNVWERVSASVRIGNALGKAIGQ